MSAEICCQGRDPQALPVAGPGLRRAKCILQGEEGDLSPAINFLIEAQILKHIEYCG